MDCNQAEIKKRCACTYSSCSRLGKCCECIEYHLVNSELPGCVFAKISKEAEISYDRSFRHFASLILGK
ncbi:MAG: DUF6485 family protein [Promethearchaeota archaeon]